MKNTMNPLPLVLFGALVAALPTQPVSAADYQFIRNSSSLIFWEATNSLNWNSNAPWDGTPPSGGPTGSDNLDLAGRGGAILAVTQNQPYAINNLSASLSGQALQSTADDFDVPFSVGGNLSVLSGAGLRLFNGAANLSLSIAVSGDVSVAGSGTLFLGNSLSTFTNRVGNLTGFSVAGTTNIAGTLKSRAVIVGSSTVDLGDLALDSGGTFTMAAVGAITSTFTSSGTIAARSLSGSGTVYGSDATQDGSRDSTLAITTEPLTNATFSGLLADSSVTPTGTGVNRLHLIVSGSGRQALAGANTYTGATTINGGVLSAAALSDGGSSSAIGASTSAASNLVINGGTLQYTGGVASTDRLFTLGAGGGTLDASGAGAVDFSNTGSTVLSGNGARSLVLTGTNSGDNRFAAVLNDSLEGATSLVKSGGGTWLLTGVHAYTGSTSVGEGRLVVDGSIADSSGVSVASGATLAGHGVVSSISGAGTVGPGNSPGILTATDVDASSGLDFSFEFTTQAIDGLSQPVYANAAESGNDLLRLTGDVPFEFSLDSTNTVTVDFTGVTLSVGDRYLGGFYSDAGEFLEDISGAQYQYLGLNGLFVTVSTIQQISDFGSGPVNGYITEFTVVPEPGTIGLFGLSALGLMAIARRKARAHS